MKRFLKWTLSILAALLSLAVAGVGYVFSQDDVRCAMIEQFPESGLEACMRETAAGGQMLGTIYTVVSSHPDWASYAARIEKAAAEGHVGAATAIGLHHFFGPQPDHRRIHDAAKAVPLLRIGAEGGHPAAQLLLANRLVVEQGAVDASEALRWPDRASPSTSSRQRLVELMTPQQIEQAQAEATAWLAICRQLERCRLDSKLIN